MKTAPDPVDLLKRLDALREQWLIHAHAIDRIYGDNNPASSAYRRCIDDLQLAITNTDPLEIQILTPP